MKNFVQVGNTLTIPAPANVASGDIVIVGDLHGIAAGDAAEDEALDLVTVGVFSLDKVGAESFNVGSAVYFDTATKLATSTASGNTKIGVATKIAVSGSAVVEVRLAAF